MEPLVKTTRLTIGSTAFSNKGTIPERYTCEGENVNPSLTIENIPTGTKTLALIMDDPDSPGGVFDHWIVWNIHPMEMLIENTVPGTEGKNSFGKTQYQGPCPPPGRAHRYFFKLYALDTLLDLQPGVTRKVLEKSMKTHILGEGEIVGTYQRTKKNKIKMNASEPAIEGPGKSDKVAAPAANPFKKHFINTQNKVYVIQKQI